MQIMNLMMVSIFWSGRNSVAERVDGSQRSLLKSSYLEPLHSRMTSTDRSVRWGVAVGSNLIRSAGQDTNMPACQHPVARRSISMSCIQHLNGLSL